MQRLDRHDEIHSSIVTNTRAKERSKVASPHRDESKATRQTSRRLQDLGDVGQFEPEVSVTATIVCPVSSAVESRSGPEEPGLIDAPPAVVRAALVPEDVERFDAQWRATMAAATESLDLGGVQRLLESWRNVARLTVGLGHDGYRRMLSEADHRLRTGEMPDNPVPIDEVRLRLAKRIAAGRS